MEQSSAHIRDHGCGQSQITRAGEANSSKEGDPGGGSTVAVSIDMLRGAATLLLLSALSLFGAPGCAAESAQEDTSDSSDAITGSVAAGKVVTVSGDALRLRRTPDLTNTKNVLGLLPVGTQVKITSATKQNGFYAVEVLTAGIKKKLGVATGWVYGDFIDQKAKDPIDNTVEDGQGTGSWNNPESMKVGVVVTDCSQLKDDQGKAMAPTIDEFLAGDLPYAVIGLDTNTYPYGMTADIAELNAKSTFNPGGIRIPLRIVKTAATQPAAGFTVTLCASDAVKASLPSEVNLTVYPDPL
jgi:hypothetical protein